MTKTILYVVTPTEYFLSHRLDLALECQRAGWEVHVAVPAETNLLEIKKYGFFVHPVNLSRTFTGFFSELLSLTKLYTIIKKTRPTVVHLISPKSIVFGGIITRILQIPTVFMKGGAGATSTSTKFFSRLSKKIIQISLRMCCTGRSVIIVHNPEAIRELPSSIQENHNIKLIQGAGVNGDVFSPSPEPSCPVRVLLPARMIYSKGVKEFVAAAKQISSRGVEAEFILAGSLDLINPDSIPESELSEWCKTDSISWVGCIKNMAQLYSSVHIVCLPSYGEGLSKSLVEAAACGKPIVCTDVPGCRDVVLEKKGGILVPPMNSQFLALALIRLIENPIERKQYGIFNRKQFCEKFDSDLIFPKYISIYEELAKS